MNISDMLDEINTVLAVQGSDSSFFEKLGIDLVFRVVPDRIQGGLAGLQPEVGLRLGHQGHQYPAAFR